MAKSNRILSVLAALGLCSVVACKTHGAPEKKSEDEAAAAKTTEQGAAAAKPVPAGKPPGAARPNPAQPPATPPAGHPAGPNVQPKIAGKPIDPAKLEKAFMVTKELFTALSAAKGDCKKAAAAMLAVHKKHPELYEIRKDFNGNPVAQRQLMGRTRRELGPLLKDSMMTSRKCQADPAFQAASKKMAGR